jgi:hypothetical protein
MASRFGKGLGQALAVAGLLCCATVTHADSVDGYRFENAAQEITQLFWLAETADVCGWTSHEDAMRFKHFSVRFLTAHLSDMHKLALVSLITENGYEDQVRRAALEGAQHNCDSSRWHTGWAAYKAAADKRDQDF